VTCCVSKGPWLFQQDKAETCGQNALFCARICAFGGWKGFAVSLSDMFRRAGLMKSRLNILTLSMIAVIAFGAIIAVVSHQDSPPDFGQADVRGDP
jgi:hypothetical protein